MNIYKLSATRSYYAEPPKGGWTMEHHWHGVRNIPQEVNKIRLLGEFTMDEIDLALENVNTALELVEEAVTEDNLLKAENFLREAAKHIHNARVCKPSKEDLQNLIIYNQELRKQVKGVKEKARFKL